MTLRDHNGERGLRPHDTEDVNASLAEWTIQLALLTYEPHPVRPPRLFGGFPWHWLPDVMPAPPAESVPWQFGQRGKGTHA